MKDRCLSYTWIFGAGVIRNAQGRAVAAFYKEFGDDSVVVAECRALCEGLKLAYLSNTFGLGFRLV